MCILRDRPCLYCILYVVLLYVCMYVCMYVCSLLVVGECRQMKFTWSESNSNRREGDLLSTI